MIKVSVIVPIYNVEQYIVRCLQSLYTQTLDEIEVLCVDDHSTDRSVELLNEFIAEHRLEKCWSVLSTPHNSGPAVARNIGIASAKGKYVAFVDSDDWIENNMLEILYLQAEEYDADISSGAAILDYPDGHHKHMMNPQVGNGVVTTNMRKYLLMHYISNFTTMIFRRNWLLDNKIIFPNTHSSEDSCYMGCCYLMCRRIAQNDSLMYHYIIHSNSISHHRHVYRGKDKRQSFKVLNMFAKQNNLWSEYRYVLQWIYLKKAILSSIYDVIKSYF